MKHKNPYYELDVRYIGTQDRTPAEIEKDAKLMGEHIKKLKAGKEATAHQKDNKTPPKRK
jgi:hypothetical protein